MCDTFVATPRVSAGGYMMLAKNSDREPNEAQNITFVPARRYETKTRLRCTHIDIPQVEHTHAVLLSRPYWMFGAEMGVNEHGVAIGNEAVFTKEPYHKKNNALTGMDLLRIALERSLTAQQAWDVIIGLIHDYGQGGSHALHGTKYYHNSFIIADGEEAFILETAGKHWALKKVNGIASISNCLTIEDDYDETSQGLEDYARQKGYVGRGHEFNFQRDYGDPLYTRFAGGKVRAGCSYGLMHGKKRAITTLDMMAILRDHNTEGEYRPGKRPMERICLHAGGIISSQTTGSMVAVLKKGHAPLVFLTGTAAPCMSIFKPHILVKRQDEYRINDISTIVDESSVDLYGTATDRYDEKTLWWMNENIHRRILMKYNSLIPKIASVRDAYEKKMVHEVEKLWNEKREKELQEKCNRYCASSIDQTRAMSDVIKKEYDNVSFKREVPLWFVMQWKMYNCKARINI